MRLLTSLLAPATLLVASTFLHAASLPKESRVPGGVAFVPLSGLTSSKAPHADFRGNRVMVVSAEGTEFENQTRWLAVVGIPLKTKSDQKLVISAGGEKYPFTIQSKEYKAQYLTIKNKKHVNPDPEQVKRWRREKAEMVAAFKHWESIEQPPVKFVLPAEGRFSSPFGLKRFYNKQPRNPHSGLDIAAPKGTPIKAPAAGTVLTVGHYFFNGKTVIVDHGQGLTTMYCHMSRIDVKPGDKLQTGDQIGAIGTTGRSTGPHLHWSVSLNNVRVDPILFLDN